MPGKITDHDELPSRSLPAALARHPEPTRPGYIVARSLEPLVELAVRDTRDCPHAVAYEVPDRGRVVWARV